MSADGLYRGVRLSGGSGEDHEAYRTRDQSRRACGVALSDAGFEGVSGGDRGGVSGLCAIDERPGEIEQEEELDEGSGEDLHGECRLPEWYY